MVSLLISHDLILLGIFCLLGIVVSLTILWRTARFRAIRTAHENSRLHDLAAAGYFAPQEPQSFATLSSPAADFPVTDEAFADTPVALAPLDNGPTGHRDMERNLRQAIENNEFSLHYQPTCNTETLTVMSYDALLRWKRPLGGGFVAPGEFIPVAEAIGVMPSIGRWALETACAEATSWRQRHGVSLNLSIKQLENPEFPSQVADILRRTGLPASRLELEVSEQLLDGRPESMLAAMHALRSQGIRIALDDFGSGAHSFDNLQSFPFDRVKIHRSFVVGLGVIRNAEAMIVTILDMARGAGLDVTATGIETESQLALLRALRCNHVQGFLLGRPAVASNIVDRAVLVTA